MNGIAPVDRLGYAFDQKAVANLAAILSATGAEIVISSSWKFLGLAALRRIWDSRKLPGHILDVTPDNESKGMEVADWLSQHGGQASNYAIIDDENDMLPEQQTHFVQTNPQFGISKKNVEELLCYGRLKTSQDS